MSAQRASAPVTASTTAPSEKNPSDPQEHEADRMEVERREHARHMENIDYPEEGEDCESRSPSLDRTARSTRPVPHFCTVNNPASTSSVME